MEILFVIIFGLIFGSFLNVCIFRYNTGLSIISSRSKCFSCSSTLKWHDMIPFFSFLIKKGRCSYCKSKISLQYPIVEVITTLVFLLVYLKNINNPILFLIDVLIFSSLIVLSLYDFKHKIIPDFFINSFILLSIFRFSYVSFYTTFSLMDFISPFIFAFIFWFLWFVSKGRLIGFADSKIVFGIGFFLGLSSGLSAIILSFWIGAIFVLIVFLLQKMNIYNLNVKINRYTEVPFGPFLCIGTLISFYFNLDLFYINLFLNI